MRICPACNASNPDDHSFCGYCGSRLALSQHDEQALPPWLGDTGASTATSTSSANAVANASGGAAMRHEQDQATSAAPDDTLPPWLRELEGAPTHTVQDTPSAATPAQPSDAPQLDTDKRSTQPIAIDNELPLWLQEPAPASLDAAADSSPDVDLPPWLRSEIPPADTATRAGSADADGGAKSYALPPWLGDAAADGSTSWEPPSWLESDASGTPTDAAIAEAESAARAGTSKPTPATDTDPLPPWLRDLDPPSSVEHAPPALGSPMVLNATEKPAHEVRASAASTPNDDLPEWLRDDVPAASAPHTAGTDESAVLPDWLRQDANVPLMEKHATSEVNDAQDLPDWLRDDAIATTSAQPRAVAPSEADDLPRWLGEDASTTPPNTGDTVVPQTPALIIEAPAAPQAATDEAAPMPAGQTTLKARLNDGPDNGSNEDSSWRSRLATASWLGDEPATPPDAPPAPDAEQVPLASEEQAALPPWLHEDTKPLSAAPASTDTAPVNQVQAELIPAAQPKAVVTPAAQEQLNATPEAMKQSNAPTPTTGPAVSPAAVSVPPSQVFAERRPEPIVEPSPPHSGSTAMMLLVVLLVIAVVVLGLLALRAGLL